MGTQPLFEGGVPVKVEVVEDVKSELGLAASVEKSSTTMSGDGGSPSQQQQEEQQQTDVQTDYVSQLKDCILQKRRLSDTKMEHESPELEDGEAEWMNTPGNLHVHSSPAPPEAPSPPPPVVVVAPSNPPPPAAAAVPSFFNWPPSNRAPPPPSPPPPPPPPTSVVDPAPQLQVDPRRNASRQFWKAGDYEVQTGHTSRKSLGIDHVRVHPKFLHSNATSHKWVLGAIAELLDNAMDEVKNGASFVAVDMLHSPKDNSPMLYIEDNGGGMTPERMRECMSLGFSTKSKSGNTIGQYGNGFKTSTMRLGADVIVFSRSPATAERRATQSIGLLSFTFLRDSGHQDIIVPMVDYELKDGMICPLIRTNAADWSHNLKTITDWCPFSSERELFTQFFNMTEKGTKVIVYNLWEDETGKVELDFESDSHDVRLRSMDADPRKMAMAQRYTYSKHYLTYHHSLRSYAAILYYRHPPGFRIILRGQEVPHHNMAEDLMQTQTLSYKPQGFESSRDHKMVANVIMGFVKDAYEHIDVQGFNVYHKNRLIKPFWKVWNTAGSDGRGIVGVLEANFVEPAHDKQSFERTAVLARLELRLQQMQKAYWSHNCHLVGYVNKKLHRRHRRQAAAETSEPNSPRGQAEGNPFAKHESLQPRLPVPGFPIDSPRVDVASPPVVDTGFHLVYRNRPSPNPAGPPGFDLSFDVPADRSGPGTPEVTTPYKHFMWQGPESELKDSPGDNRSRENLAFGFETLQMMRKGAADSANLQGLLASMTGPGQPYDLEISGELEENKLLLAGLQKLEQADERSLHFEIERNRKLERKLLDLEQQELIDRRCLEQFTRERENIRDALAEERRLHEHEDEDMRNNLKAAMLRARELEAENQRLHLQLHQS